MELFGKSVVQIKEMIESGNVSAEEVDKYFRNRIDKYDDKIKAFLTIAPEDYNKDTPSGPLNGIPLAIKDNYCTTDLRTTASSKVLENFKPKFESTVTSRLKEAGASVLGKTNMDAWAHGASSATSAYGLTYNPHDLGRYPGGSSSGSAAAVSAYLAPASIGSDTGGSIRHPASWCGVIGLKPSYGRVSRYGIAAMGSSLDSPGPMGLYMEDISLLLGIMSGRDQFDATSAEKDVPNYLEDMKKDKKYKIGVAMEYIEKSDDEVSEAVMNGVKAFEKMGHEIVDVHLLDPEYSVSVYTIVQRAEVSSNLARYHGVRYSETRENFGKEAKKRTMLGAYTLAVGYYDEYYKKAQRVRTLIRQSFDETFNDVDLIIAPTAPVTALKVGEFEKYPFFGELMDQLNEPASVAGLPAISIPTGFDSKNLPVGLQIIGPFLEESDVLNLAYQFEKETNYFDVIQKGLEKWK